MVGLCRGPQNQVISLERETGRIFSPLFPSDFPAGIKCTWVITVPEGHYVKLRMKSLKLDHTCSYSFLYIWDGWNSTGDLLNKFCGEEFQPSVFASGRYLRVHLDSSRIATSSYHAPGFDAVYEAVKQRKRQITLSRNWAFLKSWGLFSLWKIICMIAMIFKIATIVVEI